VLNQSMTGDSGLAPILPGQTPVAGFAIASPNIDATPHFANFPGFYICFAACRRMRGARFGIHLTAS